MPSIEIPSGVRGLIFDCDGTIADTMPLHYQAWTSTTREYKQEFPEDLFYALAGIPTPHIVEVLNEKHGYRLPSAAAARKDALFEEMIPKVKVIEPVVRVVRDYAGRLPMAVATGGTRAICNKTLQALKLSTYFRAVVTADDVKRGKPAPDIFLEAARRLEVPPRDCIVFEDSELGLQSARLAGMLAIDIRPWRSVN